jgi:hypothetical protein
MRFFNRLPAGVGGGGGNFAQNFSTRIILHHRRVPDHRSSYH